VNRRPGALVARWALNVSAAIGLLYLFAPIVVIVLFSFNQPRGNFNIEWQRFTLENWMAPFAEQALTDALWVSLQIAAVSTVVSTALGSMIAIGLSRYRFRGAGLLTLLLVLPVTTPEIVLGSSLATLFLGQSVVTFGLVTIVIAHVMFQLSFVTIVVRARLRDFDWTLEEAAQDLGATPMRTFWTVTFPLILPGILAAALLSFSLSIDDFIITFFNAGSTVTFPLQIFGASRNRIPPQVHVLASAILATSVGLLLLGTWLGNRGRQGNGPAAVRRTNQAV
jgi:spermidine/putrescine transport system permease protein